MSPRVREWLRDHFVFLRPRTAFLVTTLYLVLFLLNGPLIEMTLRSLWGIVAQPGWLALSSGYALAWLLGFVTPGAPGGIGIREAVFVALMGPSMGAGLAAAVAVAMRLLNVIADLIVLVIAALLDDGEQKSVPAGESEGE